MFKRTVDCYIHFVYELGDEPIDDFNSYHSDNFSDYHIDNFDDYHIDDFGD